MVSTVVAVLLLGAASVSAAPYSSPQHKLRVARDDKCAEPVNKAPELYARIKRETDTVEGKPTIDFANPSNNPANVQRVMKIMPEDIFEFLFARRNRDAYTYEGLLQAIAKFPAWCDDAADPTKKDEACRKELATTFAHFVQETGENNPYAEKTTGVPLWRQGLYWVREIGGWEYTANCEDTEYWAKYFPCYPGQWYYGRGAKQLSYPYNYGPFSEVMYGDQHVLLKDPDMVAQDPYLAFASAIWFGLTPQSPKPSMHDIIVGHYVPGDLEKAAGITAGFGATVHVINGGIECGAGGSAEKSQVQNRIAAYKNFCQYLGVTYTEDELGCRNMKNFPTNGVAALPLYWEKNWGWQACNCNQVSYQTPWNLLSKKLGHDECSCHYFGTNCS